MPETGLLQHTGEGGEQTVDRPTPVIECRGLSKHYGQVRALRGVDVSVFPGEIVGLVGDNGAGKSTFIKILSGALLPSAGELFIDGKRVEFSSSTEARALGIETVYQDLALALDLAIWTNIFLGREMRVRGPARAVGWLNRRAMANEARKELASIGMDLGSVHKACRFLSGGERQAVAVARAVAWGRRIVLMDEPTAALAVQEQKRVEDIIYQIRDKGIPVLIVSHNLPEVHRICDRILILRLGELVADLRPSDASVEDIVMRITGAISGSKR